MASCLYREMYFIRKTECALWELNIYILDTQRLTAKVHFRQYFIGPHGKWHICLNGLTSVVGKIRFLEVFLLFLNETFPTDSDRYICI